MQEPPPIRADQAVLLVNLGSPDAPTEASVRHYLNQFLMDPQVVDLPWPARRLLVSLILRTRPQKTAQAYAGIWTDAGSPLKVHARELATQLNIHSTTPVHWAMRYGSPSIEHLLVQLATEGIRCVNLLPLYPHWAMSTSETSILEAQRVIRARKLPVRLRIIAPFYSEPAYIRALANLAAEHLCEDDHLLFSYHGIPERHLLKTDPTGHHCLRVENCCQVNEPAAHRRCYRHQVFTTSELIAETLGLSRDAWSLSFQSRLGRAKWLEPYTDQTLAALAGRGIRRLAVMCPAFVADNLETIEEIGKEGRAIFMAAGGERFTLIPCLNTRSDWVEFLARQGQA